jgi:8-oxo-dGTP diphosphatase
MHVVAAVISEGAGAACDRVLLARCGPGSRHAGLWEFPGGKVEAGESPEQALIRELSEELAVEIQVHGLLTVVREPGIELSAYRAQIVAGTPVPREHDRVEWMLPTQMALLPMPALDHQIRVLL